MEKRKDSMPNCAHTQIYPNGVCTTCDTHIGHDTNSQVVPWPVDPPLPPPEPGTYSREIGVWDEDAFPGSNTALIEKAALAFLKTLHPVYEDRFAVRHSNGYLEFHLKGYNSGDTEYVSRMTNQLYGFVVGYLRCLEDKKVKTPRPWHGLQTLKSYEKKS